MKKLMANNFRNLIHVPMFPMGSLQPTGQIEDQTSSRYKPEQNSPAIWESSTIILSTLMPQLRNNLVEHQKPKFRAEENVQSSQREYTIESNTNYAYFSTHECSAHEGQTQRFETLLLLHYSNGIVLPLILILFAAFDVEAK